MKNSQLSPFEYSYHFLQQYLLEKQVSSKPNHVESPWINLPIQRIGLKVDELREGNILQLGSKGRSVHVVLLRRLDAHAFLIVPFSPYDFPATDDEYLTEYDGGPGLKVLQIWNLRTALSSSLRQGQNIGTLPKPDLEKAKMLVDLISEGKPFDEESKKRSGVSIVRTDDPRLEYRESSILSFVSFDIADLESEFHLATRFLKDWTSIAPKVPIRREIRKSVIRRYAARGVFNRQNHKIAAFMTFTPQAVSSTQNYIFWPGRTLSISRVMNSAGQTELKATIDGCFLSQYEGWKIVLSQNACGPAKVEAIFNKNGHAEFPPNASMAGEKFHLFNQSGQEIAVFALGRVSLSKTNEDSIQSLSKMFFENHADSSCQPLLDCMKRSGLSIVRTDELPPKVLDTIHGMVDCSDITMSDLSAYFDSAAQLIADGQADNWRSALEQVLPQVPDCDDEGDFLRRIYRLIVLLAQENVLQIPDDGNGYPKLVETEVLGCFCARRNAIMLFYPGILRTAQSLNVGFLDLENVILLHEIVHWAHWMSVGDWPEPLWTKSSEQLKECLAQLLPYKVFECGNDGMLSAFLALNENQTDLYHQYEPFKEFPREFIAGVWLMFREKKISDIDGFKAELKNCYHLFDSALPEYLKLKSFH